MNVSLYGNGGDSETDSDSERQPVMEKNQARRIHRISSPLKWLLIISGILFFGGGIWMIIDSWAVSSYPWIETSGDYWDATVPAQMTVAVGTIPVAGIAGIAYLIFGLVSILFGAIPWLWVAFITRVIRGRINLYWSCMLSVWYSLLYVTLTWLFGVRNWMVTVLIACAIFTLCALTSIAGWWAKLGAIGTYRRFKRLSRSQPMSGVETTIPLQQNVTLKDYLSDLYLLATTGVHHLLFLAVKTLAGLLLFMVAIYYFVQLEVNGDSHWGIIVNFALGLAMPLVAGIVEFAFLVQIREHVFSTSGHDIIQVAAANAKEPSATARLYLNYLTSDMICHTVFGCLIYMFIEFTIHL